MPSAGQRDEEPGAAEQCQQHRGGQVPPAVHHTADEPHGRQRTGSDEQQRGAELAL
jgi:hypothetical protein